MVGLKNWVNEEVLKGPLFPRTLKERESMYCRYGDSTKERKRGPIFRKHTTDWRGGTTAELPSALTRTYTQARVSGRIRERVTLVMVRDAKGEEIDRFLSVEGWFS